MDENGVEGVRRIGLGSLRAHPRNSNVMRRELLEKLAGHVRSSGRYPPLIVRPMPGELGAYQVLDGHHRWRVLERLGHERAACVVWDVDDEGALVLLATLNRLEGRDAPKRRSELIAELRERYGRGVGELARVLPERAADVKRYLEGLDRVPEPRTPRALGEMPVSVHFFLSGAERDELESVLNRAGGTREEALMRIVRGQALA